MIYPPSHLQIRSDLLVVRRRRSVKTHYERIVLLKRVVVGASHLQGSAESLHIAPPTVILLLPPLSF